jgi:hypothetical protein
MARRADARGGKPMATSRTASFLLCVTLLAAAAIVAAPPAAAQSVCLFPDANGVCGAGGSIACPSGPQCFNVIVDDDCEPGLLLLVATFPVTVMVFCGPGPAITGICYDVLPSVPVVPFTCI